MSGREKKRQKKQKRKKLGYERLKRRQQGEIETGGEKESRGEKEDKDNKTTVVGKVYS